MVDISDLPDPNSDISDLPDPTATPVAPPALGRAYTPDEAGFLQANPDFVVGKNGRATVPGMGGSSPSYGPEEMRALKGTRSPDMPAKNAMTVGDAAKGAPEFALNMATGGAAALGGGLGYLGTLAFSGGDTGAAANSKEAIENTFTYQPRSKGGQAMTGGLGDIAGEFANKAADVGEKKLGIDPTITHAVLQAAPWLLGAGSMLRGGAGASAALDTFAKNELRAPEVPTNEAAAHAAASEGGAALKADKSLGKGKKTTEAAPEPAAEPETNGVTADELMNAPEPTPPVVPPEPAAPKPAVKHTVDTDTGEHRVTSDNGETMAQESGPYLQVKRSDTLPSAQGQGEGSARMEPLLKHADENNLVLGSDVSVSPAATAVWDKLGKDTGRAIRVNPHDFNPETGNVVSRDPRTPVFELEPKPPEDLGADTGKPFSVVSAERSEYPREVNATRTAQLEKDLRSEGLNPSASMGSYKGSQERSFIVGDTTPETRAKVEEIGRKYDQESVLHVDENRNAALHYANTDQLPEPIGKWGPVSAQEATGHDGWTRDSAGNHYTVQQEAEPVAKAPLSETNPAERGGPRAVSPNVSFRHFSNADEPKVTLNPKMYGAGIKGAESARVENGAPKSISLYGADHPNNMVEPGLRGKPEYRVTVPRSKMYDLSEDPKGFMDKAVDKNGSYNHSRTEQLIKSAGYLGYHLPEGDGIFRGQGRIFKPVDAERVNTGNTRPLSSMLPNQRGGPKAAAPEVPAKISANLTEPERAQLRSNTAGRVVDAFKNLPPTEELAAAALAGRAKRGWYQKAAEAITTAFGPDAPRFSSLLASMSPQTSVEMNFHNALRTFINWDNEGRPTDPAAIKKIMGQSVLGDKGEASVLGAWTNNSVRSLTHPNPENMTISGPKVNSFMSNLHGKVNEVTLDSWMAAFAKMDAKKLGGSINAAETGPGKSPMYLGYSAKVRDAAGMLSRLTGEKWTPAEAQETIWSWAKTATEHADSFKGLGTIPELVKNKEITDELIKGTSDFHSLFHAPEHADVLAKSRFAESAGRVPKEAGGTAQSAASSEAIAAAESHLAPHLENAANRLEEVRQERNQRGEPAPKTEAADKYRMSRAMKGQRGSVGVWGQREDLAPAGGERPAPAQNTVADTLRRVLGKGTEVRDSAVTGDPSEASADYQQSKLKNETGEKLANTISGERGGLQAYAKDLISRAGGTEGTDRGANRTNGSTIEAPIAAYNEHLENLTQQHYAAATAKAQGKPIRLSGTEDFLANNKSKFLGTVEGKQLLEGLTARMKELGLTGPNDTFNPATVEQAERVRQYMKENWTPRTNQLIKATTNALDDDVTKTAGTDIYKQARAVRALRATNLEEPEGVSDLLRTKEQNRLGINRKVDLEDIPNHVESLPVDQFQHVVNTIRTAARGNADIAPKSAAALNAIRSQFANRVNEIANGGAKDTWNQKGVEKYLKDNLIKMQAVFKPAELAQYHDLANAGSYLDINRSYPGAAVQGHNLMTRGAMTMVEHAPEAGALLGHVPGMIVGAGAKALGGNIEKKANLRAAQKRIRTL